LSGLDRVEPVVTIRPQMKFLPFMLGLTLCAGFKVGSAPAVIDGIRSVVSSQVITYSEVEDFARPAADQLSRQYAGQPDIFRQKLNEALGDSLQQLVERQLILRSFETGGYRLPETVVDEVMQERIRERFGDRVTFMKKLQEMGLTAEQFRKQVRNQYIESALRNQNGQRDVFVSPYKIENYYLAHQDEFRMGEEIKLRTIVLTRSGPDDTNSLALMREIQSRIKDGASFAEMASVYSQGSQRSQGGDWGWVGRSVLHRDLAEAAFSQPLNTVSDVIVTADACYLLLVENKRPAQVRPLIEVAGEIEKNLRLQIQSTMQKKWIDGLKQKTFVRYF
jgi:parvulin-like peptidyl-prolyl isomerase